MLKQAKAKAKAESTGSAKSHDAVADLPKSILESSRQIWLAGLGAFSKAQAGGMKVFETLVEQGEVLEKKTRHAAADAAAAIGVQVGQIVKSLIFGVDGDIVLAYVSGANQLSEPKLAAAAGGRRCERVDADTVRAATGYPIGGVPPFGHSTHLRVFIDPDLLQYDEVWAAAGTWHDVFGIEPHRLVEASGGLVTDLKRA